jgi:hypothetical protein
MKELYVQFKKDVVSLAIAGAKNFDAAFVCLERTFKRASKQTGRLRDPEKARLTLLKTVLREAKRAKRRGRFASKLLNAGESEFIDKLFSGMGEDPLSAWTLKYAIGVPDDGISFVTRRGSEKVSADLSEAEEKLSKVFPALSPGEAAERYAAILEKLSDGAEVWGNISFYVENRRKNIIPAVIGIALVLAAAMLGAREAFFLIKSWSIPAYSRDSLSLAELPDSPTYWENCLIEPDEEYPSVNRSFMDTLAGLPDDVYVPVDFVFYDRDVMRSVTEQGHDLESLYTELYEKGSDTASVNRAISLGILEYYRTYEIPWLPEKRDKDFVSPYKSIYESTIKRLSELSGDETYSREIAVTEKHPEIFSDEESFNAYMYSMRFISEAPIYYGLLAAEYEMKAYLSGGSKLTEAEADELRLRYETEIFAFYHRTGGKFEPLDSAVTYEELEPYFAVRESIAERLKRELEKACAAVEGIVDIKSEYRSVYDISGFSALMTKARILELAKTDGRFKFYGVSLDRPEGYPSNMENELALMLALEEKPGTRYTIYRVDDEYVEFSTNYWVPYRLPEGFIKDLRDKIPCDGSMFEFQVGYHFTNGVGHKAVLSKLQLLREMYIHPDSFFYCYNNYFMDDT